MAFADRQWVSRDGLRLYARDYAGDSGDCRLPVICLHGITRNSKDFEEVAPHIAAGGRRVIVPDVRGRGRSDRDSRPERYQPLVYARDVREMMDRLGITSAVFVGTSMGGIITMTLAALRPKAIAAAVLNDVGPEIGREGLERILSYVGKPVSIESWGDAADYMKRINGVAFPDYADADWQAFARRTFRDESGKPVLDYDPAITVPLATRPIKTRSLVSTFLFHRLARKRPILLVRGELSDLLTAQIAERMAKAAPRLKVAVIPRVGHAPTLAEPEARKAIDEFLASVP